MELTENVSQTLQTNLLPDNSTKSIATFVLIVVISLLILYYLVIYFTGSFFSIARFQNQNTLYAFQYFQ